MTFHSILSEHPATTLETPDQPAHFTDLNLDQVVDAITAEKQEYDLKPFFYTALKDTASIVYRQEVFRDLEGHELWDAIEAFADEMCAMRECLDQAEKLHHRYQKERWFIDAVTTYCNAVSTLAGRLRGAALKSRGFSGFRDFLTGYVDSGGFIRLYEGSKLITDELSTIRYAMVIRGSTVKVRRYESEADYGEEIERTFEKFKQGAVKDRRAKLSDWAEMNSVETKVLEFVAALNPEAFKKLDDYYADNQGYVDKTVGAFDREVQFYLAYLGHIEKIKRIGLQFCYPQLSNPGKDVLSREGFDLALADKLTKGKKRVVTNDFYLEGEERVIVVSGPNQGGKTTFARTFGQLHYLASMGCPVPGREARLFGCDRIFTHFERKEDIKNLSGKLQDDLVRISAILDRATPDSIVILNEIFTSTTLSDAVFLSERVMDRVGSRDLLCVWVTFIDELSHFSEKTVSMVSTVIPEDPAKRTFKIVRKPADGLSYAISISEKYRLTYELIKERLDHKSVSHV